MARIFKDTQELILYEMYWFFSHPDAPEDVPTELIFEPIANYSSSVFRDESFRALLADDYIEHSGVLPDVFSITGNGIKYVEEQLNDPSSFLANHHEAARRDEDWIIPASDRVVTLNHNSQEYRSAIVNLTDLREALNADNVYRAHNLEDHERRIADVEAAISLLQGQRVRAGAIRAVAYGTLIYLAEKFAEAPIGELAKAAWEALKILLGLG